MYRGTNFIRIVIGHGYCEIVNRTWRAANFLYARWQAYEAGAENCQGIQICHPEEKMSILDYSVQLILE